MKCLSQPFTIALLNVERNVIIEDPPYQRESGIWSVEKQRLFIDSLFNDFDVPKLYFHDVRSKQPPKHYAVVDGKQRLHAIWQFLSGALETDDGFRVADDLGQPPAPSGAVTFASLSPFWQAAFTGKSLSVVLIDDADDDDIEELFFRLNNGEALNAAEKRNALGGVICDQIRETAKHSFFTDTVSVSNKRYQHYEIAAKFLLIEKTESDSGAPWCDLKKKFLDKLVNDNKKMPSASVSGLAKRVDSTLKLMQRIFSTHDPLLSKQAYSPMYYLWVKIMAKEYAHPSLYTLLREFAQTFAANRVANLSLNEDERDSTLIEFGRLMQQGTNDLGSLQTRVNTLRRYFLEAHPDVELRDHVRSFSEEERYAIWVLGGKQCAECGKALPELEDMEADHKRQWAHGGPTTLENGRSLCEICNASLAKQVA